ncbi:ABC transporter permease subunit [Paenibacillus sp. GCM10027627]|uniref:ABC transporter permease subunit n=1 Tax=unclassified Paenibacillus TaxID=185978 RepID=UPI0036423E89
MNMYWHELRMYRGTMIGWTVALAGMAVMFMSMYPAFAEDAEQVQDMMKSLPEAVIQAVGLQIDGVATLLGFYSYIFLNIALCGAIQAMQLGTSIVSKETREKTADFLLTKPVTRGAVLTSKGLAALTVLAVTNVFYFGVSALMAYSVQRESFSFDTFALINGSLFGLQLMFLAIGFAAALLFPRLKTVLPLSLGSVFGFFMLSAVSEWTGDGPLRYVTPFQYFERSYIVEHGAYEPAFLIAGAVMVAGCIGFSFVRYLKRDVHVG